MAHPGRSYPVSSPMSQTPLEPFLYCSRHTDRTESSHPVTRSQESFFHISMSIKQVFTRFVTVIR